MAIRILTIAPESQAGGSVPKAKTAGNHADCLNHPPSLYQDIVKHFTLIYKDLYKDDLHFSRNIDFYRLATESSMYIFFAHIRRVNTRNFFYSQAYAFMMLLHFPQGASIEMFTHYRQNYLSSEWL